MNYVSEITTVSTCGHGLPYGIAVGTQIFILRSTSCSVAACVRVAGHPSGTTIPCSVQSRRRLAVSPAVGWLFIGPMLLGKSRLTRSPPRQGTNHARRPGGGGWLVGWLVGWLAGQAKAPDHESTTMIPCKLLLRFPLSLLSLSVPTLFPVFCYCSCW